MEKQVKAVFVLMINVFFLNRPNSSEQQEMERIRILQSEVALHRRKNEASYKAALAGSESTLLTLCAAATRQQPFFKCAG